MTEHKPLVKETYRDLNRTKVILIITLVIVIARLIIAVFNEPECNEKKRNNRNPQHETGVSSVDISINPFGQQFYFKNVNVINFNQNGFNISGSCKRMYDIIKPVELTFGSVGRCVVNESFSPVKFF